MLKKPEFKFLKTKLHSTNPALSMFLLVTIIGIGGISLYAFDGKFDSFEVKVESEKTYDYKAEEILNLAKAPIGYRINFDKTQLKYNKSDRGAHSIEDFIKETGACAAVNANFYHTDGKQLGLYADNYNRCADCPGRGFVDALFLKTNNKPSNTIAQNEKYYLVPDIYWNTQNTLSTGVDSGISGKLVIKDGIEQPLSTKASSYSYLGWDSNGEIFAYSFFSSNASLHIKKMIEQDIKYAIMLDGGGSSQMYSLKGTVSDNTRLSVIQKPRQVPYYIGAGNCGVGNKPVKTPAEEASIPSECTTKAGFNPGQGAGIVKQSKFYARTKEYGMNSLLAIVESEATDLESASAFVSAANSNGIKPLIRFCTKDSDCARYKNPDDMANFIRELSKAGNFVVILGPNEPNLEKWKGNDFFEIGKFTAEVASKLNNINNVELLTVAFDTAYHLNMSLKDNPSAEYAEINKIDEYFKGLGNRKVLNGIALNAYSIDGVAASDRVEYFMNYLKAKGYGLEGSFNKIYITEFGWDKNKQPNFEQLRTSFEKLNGMAEIQSILFFDPFEDIGNPGFTGHYVSPDELNEILDLSEECQKFNKQLEVKDSQPRQTETNSSVSATASGKIVNTKLEYCKDSSSNESQNCIDYARYYDEAENEAYSCQTSEITQKTLEIPVKLEYDSISDSYIGQAVLAGRIRNFPMLRHWGSVSYGEYRDVASVLPTSEGTNFNPYQPVCSFLSEVFPGNGNSVYITHEFGGKLVFYDDEGNSYEYNMPRLGNGIGCMNLLSITNSAGTVSGSILNDFPGFDITTMSADERKFAYCRSKQARILDNKTDIASAIKLITEDKECQLKFPDNSESYDVGYFNLGDSSLTELFQRSKREPILNYEEGNYCNDQKTYTGETIRYINKGSNSMSEAYAGPSRAIRVDNIKINLSSECNKPDSTFSIRNVNGISLKSQVCDGSPEVAAAFFKASFNIPTYIGIPGGMSAYSILTEYVQKAAATKLGKIITPPNGVRILGEFNVQSGEGIELGDKLPASKDPIKVEYVMPYMDYQPLLVALQYVLNNENDSSIHNDN